MRGSKFFRIIGKTKTGFRIRPIISIKTPDKAKKMTIIKPGDITDDKDLIVTIRECSEYQPYDPTNIYKTKLWFD